MSNVVLVRGARQVLTLHGAPGPRRGAALKELAVIQDGSVLIQDGKIIEVGTTRRIENLALARDAHEIDATGRLIMPAFVDSRADLLCPAGHTPPTCQLPLFEIDSTPISSFVERNYRQLDASARHIISACVRHGTGTIEVRSSAGESAETDIKVLRAARALSRSQATVVPSYAPGCGCCASRQEHPVLSAIQAKSLASFAIWNCDRHRDASVHARRYAELTARHGLRMKFEAGTSGPSELIPAAMQLEAAGLEGLNHISEMEALMLGRCRTIATLMPALTFCGIHDRYPPARTLIDSGVAVALASGFRYGGNATFNMQMVAALAATRLKMTPAEAISAATINSAYAVGYGDRKGSLEYGKDGDLLILNVQNYQDIIHYFGVNLVHINMKKGQVVYRESEIRCPPS